MTQGARSGGHTSAPSTEGWKEVTSYLDFFPWVILNNSALALSKDQGGGGWIYLRGIPCTLSCLN